MTPDDAARTLKPFVDSLVVGEPLVHGGLTLVPLSGPAPHADYLLAEDAFAAGLLNITETSPAGAVPELLARNAAEVMVLLLDGEELVGAKQNRILNTSVLLPPKSATKIPVSCVEQGRWRPMSDRFSSGGFSPSRLRAMKSRAVKMNLEMSGEARSDQGEVWDEVQRCMSATGAASPTMAMHDAIEQRKESLEDYARALPWPEGSRGMVAAIGGKLAALDMFDKPETLRRMWPRLVGGYALDALTRGAREGGEFTGKGARELLEHLAGLACQSCPTVGVGEDWRFDSVAVVGQALVLQPACVHLSAFPNDSAPDAGQGRPIQSPSRRRRNLGRNSGQGAV